MMSMRQPPLLHELEAEIMDEVWRRGECTVREVLDVLNARSDAQRAYTTVMTVMHRLVGQGLLRRGGRGRSDLFAAVMRRLDGRELLRRARRASSDLFPVVISRDSYADASAGAEVDALVSAHGDV